MVGDQVRLGDMAGSAVATKSASLDFGISAELSDQAGLPGSAQGLAYEVCWVRVGGLQVILNGRKSCQFLRRQAPVHLVKFDDFSL